MICGPADAGTPRLSGLYEGVVTHQRQKPVRHALRYRVFSLLLDLDELDAIAAGSRLFARNRFALLSFYDRDHGIDESGRPGVADLRAWINQTLAQAGLPVGGGVRILCFPRILGYVFNPLTVWFCYAPDAAPDAPPMAILYEVANTFGERHGYLLPARPGPDGVIRHACPKRFYVSPFIDMGMTYQFRIVPPGAPVGGDHAGVQIAIHETDATGPVLDAVMTLRRRPLSDATLLRAWLRHPLMTLKVIAAIHWEAVLLLAKGLRVRPRPPRPATSVCIIKEPTP